MVEEAPAFNLSRDTVKRMGEEAVALAKAVGYSSAGTVSNQYAINMESIGANS